MIPPRPITIDVHELRADQSVGALLHSFEALPDHFVQGQQVVSFDGEWWPVLTMACGYMITMSRDRFKGFADG